MGAVGGPVVLEAFNSHAENWGLFLLAAGGGCCATVLAVIGIVVATIGRMWCLETPAEWPIARSRIRLAVILDVCGLLSGLVNVGVAYAANTGSITMPPEVLWSVFGFSLILLVAGRVFFVAYVRSLARALGKSTKTRLSIGAVVVIVLPAFAVPLTVSLYLIVDPHTPLTGEGILAVMGLFVVAAVVLTGLYAYGSLLRRVREAVRQSTVTPVAVDEVESD
jgi:hypothetical protein